MAGTLREKAIRGFYWSGIEKLFQQVFVFAAGMLLARLLQVEDYGVVAVLAIFTYLANSLQESGFIAALIQKPDADRLDYNTCFYFNIGVAAALYALLFACAPLIAHYYDNPPLTALARFVFLSFVLNALCAVQYTQVIKSLNYKLNTKINIYSMLLSYTLAVALAFFHCGAWALASQMVSLAFFRAVLLWASNRWHPERIFSFARLKALFAFGGALLLQSILGTVSSRITPNVLAKYLSLHASGIFDNGNRIYSTFSDTVQGMYLNVTYPVLAKVENESDLLRVYRKMNRVLAFILFPLTALAVLCASGFVTVILGAKWEPAIPVIQLLALGGMFITFRGFSWNILKIKKKTNFILFNEIIYSVLMFGGLFAGVFLQWSLNAIVGCIGLAHAVGYAVNYFYIRHLINYQLRSHIADLLPYFGISALAFGAAWLFTLIIDVPVWLLVVQIAVFAGVYLSTAYFAGSAIFREVMSLVKRHFLGKK